MKLCANKQCGKLLGPRWARGRPPSYCSRMCQATAAAHRKAAATFLEAVQRRRNVEPYKKLEDLPEWSGPVLVLVPPPKKHRRSGNALRGRWPPPLCSKCQREMPRSAASDVCGRCSP